MALFLGPRLAGYSAVNVEDLTTVELRSRELAVGHLEPVTRSMVDTISRMEWLRPVPRFQSQRFRAVVRPVERGDMSPCAIGYMDEIAFASPVGGRVICAENLQWWTAPDAASIASGIR